MMQLAPEFRVHGKQGFFGREAGVLWHRTARSTTKRTVYCPRAGRAAYGGLEHRFHLGAKPMHASQRKHETPNVPTHITHCQVFLPAA